MERLAMPLSLQPKRTRSFIGFDPGRVNAGLAAGMCFGPAPTAAEFLASFADKVQDRMDVATQQSAWGEPGSGNRFFMPLASFHIDFDKSTRDAWIHPAFEPEVQRKYKVVENAIINATQAILDGMERIQGNEDTDEDPGFTLVPPENEPMRYEAPEADVCYPNAHMVRIAAGKNTPPLRQTLRNVVSMMFKPEIAGMLWGFGQIPVVIEPQPEHVMRHQHGNMRYRPHVIRMIQHTFELIITAVDYAMGFTSTRPFIYAIGKWGVREAVMRWFPEDYASVDEVPEDETADMTTAQYNHRKQAVKNLIMLVCAAHKDGHGLLAYMNGKASKDEDETDAMALILRGHQVTMRTRRLTEADIEAHSETLDQTRQLDRMWHVVQRQDQAPEFTGTQKDFVKKRAPSVKKKPTKKREATPSDFVIDDAHEMPDDEDEYVPPKKTKRAAKGSSTPRKKRLLLSDLIE